MKYNYCNQVSPLFFFVYNQKLFYAMVYGKIHLLAKTLRYHEEVMLENIGYVPLLGWMRNEIVARGLSRIYTFIHTWLLFLFNLNSQTQQTQPFIITRETIIYGTILRVRFALIKFINNNVRYPGHFYTSLLLSNVKWLDQLRFEY